MLKTLTTQYGLGNDNFPHKLESCCSIHATVFAKPWTKRDKTDNNDNDNDKEDTDGEGLLTAHIAEYDDMDSYDQVCALIADGYCHYTEDNGFSIHIIG